MDRKSLFRPRLKATEKQQELCDAKALATKSLEEALGQQELTLGDVTPRDPGFRPSFHAFSKLFIDFNKVFEGF